MSEKPIHQTPPRIALYIRLGVAAGLAAWSAPAAQAEIWRCGSSYSEQPCAGGRPVEADDVRSPEQQRDALRGARDNAAAAKELEHQRLRAQATQPGAVLIGVPRIPPAKPRPSTKKDPKAKRVDAERFVARDPLAPSKKKKSGKAAASAAP